MKGNTLRVRRAERRVSQLDLAVQLGMSPNRFWRIENGYALPTEAERAAIAQALGVPESEIWPEPSDAADADDSARRIA